MSRIFAGRISHPYAKLAAAGAAIIVLLSYFILSTPEPANAARVQVTCTDSTSDAQTINNAILGSAEGDEIVIDGPCLINQTIRLLGGRAYSGESRTGTSLTQAAGANLDQLMASDSYLDDAATTGKPLSIRSLKIDGNSQNNTAATDGIVIRSWQSTIEDVLVTWTGGHGIRVTSVSDNGTTLTNTQVNGNIENNFVWHTGGHGIYVEDPVNSVTDWWLVGNWVSDAGIDSIHLENAAGWAIDRNHVYGSQQHGINAERLFATSISNNYIEPSFGQADNGIFYGIRTTVQDGRPSTISGNRVRASEFDANSTYRYIGVARVNFGTGVVSVTGNALRGAGTSTGTGLDYRKGSGTALEVTSTGNAVHNVNTPIFAGSGVTVSAGY